MTMPHEPISSRNTICLIGVVALGGTVLGGAYGAGSDIWIALLTAFAAAVPVALIYARLVRLYPGADLFTILQKVFGRVGGGVFIALMSLYAILLGALAMRYLTEYTAIVTHGNTPRLPLMLALTAVAVYLAKGGFRLLGRWSLIVFIFVAVNVICALLLSIGIMDLSHLLPVMSHSTREIASDALTFGTVSLGEVVFALVLFGAVKKGGSSYKTYLWGLSLGTLFLLLSVLRNLLVLGPDLYAAADYPTYMAVRVISLGNFFARFESLISINYILLTLTKTALFLSAAAMGLSRLWGVENHKKLVMPAGLLTLALCSVILSGLPDMLRFIAAYRFWALVFQLLIPLTTWVAAEIRGRRSSS